MARTASRINNGRRKRETEPRSAFKYGVRRANLSLAQRAVALLQAERPMTLRQLFYRLLSEGGHLANSPKEYKRLGRLMTGLREARDVPLRWLVDHVRATIKPSSWSGLADFAETVRDAYRKDFWAHTECLVEVIIEKDATAGTVQPVTVEFDVPLRVIRGYSSVSFAAEAADEWRESGKPVHAYYAGDFDPRGIDLERDIREKLARYSGRECCGHDEPDGRSFSWQRLAILPTDFADHNLIRLPLKAGDKCAPKFRRQYGDSAAELDALPPTVLRSRVREAIVSHIDPRRWERLQHIERLEREQFATFMAQMGQGSDYGDLE